MATNQTNDATATRQSKSASVKLSPAQKQLLAALESGPRSFSDSNANMSRVAACLEKCGLVTVARGKDIWTWTVARTVSP